MASCEPISCAELQTLLSQQERTQRRWAELGSTFWLRLVVSKRSDILTKCAQYQNISLDSVYIDLLKMLVGKSYGKIHKYFSDISQLLKSNVDFKNLQTFLESKPDKQKKNFGEIFKQLFGAEYMTISPWWLQRCFKLHRKLCSIVCDVLTKEESEFEFEIPPAWKKGDYPWPFEIFLRSRWGDELLKIVNCDKKKICWWTDQLNDEDTYNTPCKQIIFDNDIFEEVVWIYKFSHWMYPHYIHTFFKGDYEMKENIFFQHLKKDGVKILMWDILDLSIPPMWHTKFYGKLLELTHSFTDTESLDRCVWISTWLHTLELDFMVLVQQAQEEFLTHGADHVEDGLPWKDRMLEYKKTLEFMHSLPNAPRLTDVENNVMFMFQGELLTQLPWYHNLLQLWLAAALMEVTRFEIASMELRHWPLPEKLAQQAVDLLSAVCLCKSRLLLGLALLCNEVNIFPEFNTSYPRFVMEEVILYVGPMLQFMIGENGYTLLRELKRAAWGKNNKLGPANKSVPALAYLPNSQFSEILYNHFFHIQYWMGDKLKVPYPKQKYDLKELAAYLKTDFGFEYSFYYINELSTEESLCEASLQNFSPKGDPRELVTKICQDVLSEAPTPEGIRSAERHALLAIKIAEFTSGLQTEETPSLLRCLVRLTGEALVREQEVRVAAICAQASGHPMALHDLPPDYDVMKETKDMYKKFNVVRESLLRKSDRSWLDGQLRFMTEPLAQSRAEDDDIIMQRLMMAPSDRSFHFWFREYCSNIICQSLDVLYNAYEKKIRCKPVIDPYLFYCLASFMLLPENAEKSCLKKEQLSGLTRYFCASVIIRTYNRIRAPIKHNTQSYLVRAPIPAGENRTTVTRAHVSTAQLCFDNHMAVFNVIASLCVADHPDRTASVMKALLLGTTCFKDNTPRHKLEMLLWKGWSYTFYKEWHTQRTNGECVIMLVRSKATSLGHLCYVRDALSSFAHLVLVTCELLPDKKEQLPYKILKQMLPVFLEKSLQLYKYFIYNETFLKNYPPDINALGVDADKKVSKDFIDDVQDFLVKFFTVIFAVRKFLPNSFLVIAEEIISEMHLIEIGEYIHESDYEETISKHLKLRVPPSESRRAQVLMVALAKQYLNVTLDPPGAAPVQVAVEEEATTPVEVCHACKKQAGPRETFFTFEGKFYCSVQCKTSVGSTRQWCRFCKKKEKSRHKFLLCRGCQEDEKYPEPNYFCSEECEDEWWNKEHHAEHLEFELGLGRWFVPQEQPM